LGWVGLGPIFSLVVGWVGLGQLADGLGWVTQNGPMDNSAADPQGWGDGGDHPA